MEAAAPARGRFGSTTFWRVFAAINLVTVVWVVWLIWQLTPRHVVHDFVLRLPPLAARSHRTAIGTIPVVPAAPARASAVATPPAAQAEIPMQSGPPMTPLRLETEIKAVPK